MKKIILAIIGSVLLTSCTSNFYEYPDAYKGFYFKGKYPKSNKQAKQTQIDMISCGFENSYNNINMIDKDINSYILAVQCMQNKGYTDNDSPNGDICQHKLFKDKSACQKQNNH